MRWQFCVLEPAQLYGFTAEFGRLRRPTNWYSHRALSPFFCSGRPSHRFSLFLPNRSSWDLVCLQRQTNLSPPSASSSYLASTTSSLAPPLPPTRYIQGDPILSRCLCMCSCVAVPFLSFFCRKILYIFTRTRITTRSVLTWNFALWCWLLDAAVFRA